MAIRMKMKQEKIGIASALGLVVLVVLGLYGASNYMLNYSLNYPKEERMTAEHWKNRMKNECPWMIGWMDSVYQHHCVKDTFVTMPSGYKAHAIYLYAPKTTENTAVVVHGYQVRSEGMLHIAYLYNHDMGYNVLLPDLYGHGESEGDHIQMGWKDRWDVIRWSEIANEIFRVKGEGQRVKGEDRRVKNTRQVIHGISMGAATTMAVSGEKTPDYVKCFVEDCGYTSVWDEFSEAAYKSSTMLGFSVGVLKCLITKPKIAGFGMNWQNCHNMIFVGLSDSYEQYYQAVRRCWRFGQTQPVDVYIIISAKEGTVKENIERKEADAINMRTKMAELTRESVKENLSRTTRIMSVYKPTMPMRLPAWAEMEAV